ncbi:MAG: HNH endonuclease signature motif containing protein [Acidimicrobiia bacterium]
MPGIRDLIGELCSELARVEPGRYSGDDCAEIAEHLALAEKACGTARVRFGARASECGAHRKRGFAGANDWLARAAGSSEGAVRTELATVAAVETCPATKKALVAGEVSLAQAAEIARVPGCEAELLEVARTESLSSLKRKARRKHLESIDPEDLHAEQHRCREVRHWNDELGMRRGTFAFTPEFGTRFANRLDAETDRVWREARRAGRSTTRAQCAADAFERLFEGTGNGNTRTPDLVFVYDLNGWVRGHTHPGEVGHILGGGPCPVSLARKLAVDAFVKVVLHDGTKVDTIVHYGRRRPALLQTVLDLGDPPDFDGVACAEEGCDRRFGLQWDHKDPVANDGPSSAENFQPLCYPHHVEKTERDRQAGLLNGQRKERGPP